MSELRSERRIPRPLSELADVFGFLDGVRLRPGMWVRSLDELHSILIGYRVALEVHGIAEDCDFWPLGPFAEWLWAKLGRHSSPGWWVEIDREAEASGDSSIDVFFRFLDEYRAAVDLGGSGVKGVLLSIFGNDRLGVLA